MYSQCPECLARFRVGADDLRAAGGTVRCGRCGSAFNALTWLSDSLPPPLGKVILDPSPAELDVHTAQPERVSGVEFHFTSSDIESVFVDPSDWANRPGASGRGSAAGDVHDFAAGPPIIVDIESRPFEDITLEGEGIRVEDILGIDSDMYEVTSDNSQTDEFEVLAEVPDSAYSEEEEAASPPDAMFATDIGPVVTADDLAVTEPPVMPDEEPDSEASLAAALEGGRSRARPRRSIAWSIGGLLLVLVLLAQVTHYFRQDLVRHPQIGPVLKDIYSRIGRPLSPNWDLAAFELRQWGNGGAPDANGQLTVRASLSNRANFAQPHPILRLELDNRFGDAIAVRDFEPAEYLKDASEASRMLGPGASAEAELLLVDPGRDAVGYQLDICLRESATILRCAREAN
ncbi:MAG: DUF3426 domain-containing protein [Steroidobacteraceae bacterium]|nr:DUF3426 domain-containing protein [Steroidobacteraceae bacterium]